MYKIPQMSPMDWMILMIFFMMIYFMLFINLYFFLKLKFNMSNMNYIKNNFLNKWY